MTREEILAKRDELDSEWRSASLHQKYIRDKLLRERGLERAYMLNGMTPDVVKADPQYAAISKVERAAFASLRAFNDQHWREYRKRA